ncbi:MAG: hypothetical protein WBW53_06405 [Terriglobales bacterium]
MNYRIFRFCMQFVAASLLTIGVQSLASNASPVSGSLVSGTYDVLRNTDVGSQSQIVLRVHLVNHGALNLSIQRITIWDFSHPERGGSRACAIALAAHASANTTQEFTIRRSDYQLWQKGVRPRLVLQLAGSRNTKAVVRLDRTSRQEVK